jgi:hypothetical protein
MARDTTDGLVGHEIRNGVGALLRVSELLVEPAPRMEDTARRRRSRAGRIAREQQPALALAFDIR